jgi:MFS family permease
MFRSLRHPAARRFFLGLAVSNVGTWMQFTGMSLLVYRLTGRATDVGITLFCQFLPMLLLGAWAGAVSDRVDKRKMAMLTQAGMGVQALLLGVLTLVDRVNLPIVFVLSLVLGVLGAFDNPARRGMVVELVEPAEIPNALALNTAVMTGSRIFGPALAALLVDPLGPGWLFVINGVSFIAIVGAIATVRPQDRWRTPTAPKGGQPVREALRFVRGHARLFPVFVIFTIVGTFAFNYSVSLLKLAAARFDDESWFGWLLAVTSIGSLAGSLVAAGAARLTTRWFYGAMTLLGVSGLAVAFSPSVAVAMIVSIPMGAGGAVVIAALNGISQEESPPDMRGRILALGAVAFLGSTPIGSPITGWIADHVSAEWSLAYGSVISLVCAAVGMALRRRRLAASAGDVPPGEHEVVAAMVEHGDGGGVVVERGSGVGREAEHARGEDSAQVPVGERDHRPA